MEKLNGETLNIVNENIEKLKQLFPEAFREGKIDFETLKAELGESVENGEERYSFNWNGKAAARRIAQTPSTGTLRPCPSESVDWDTTQNLFLEGDNLEVLKLLQKSYHSKVKMIYIDPPYNTGKEFIYPDNFHDNLDTYLQYTGQKDAEGKKFGTNAETSGRYHTNWLNMMYPRLKLARNLLRDDGVIFISIDDNEVHNLRKICDEIFGEDNFIGLFVVNSSPSAIDYGDIGKMHEYALFYAKNIMFTVTNQIPEKEKVFKYSDSNGPFNIYPLYNGNVAFNPSTRPNLYYPFYLNPNKKIDPDFFEISLQMKPDWVEVFPVVSRKDNIQRVWRWGREKAQQGLNDEIIGYKTEDGEFRVVQKSRHTGKVIRSLLIDKDVQARRGTAEVENLFNAKFFSFPKSVDLIKRFVCSGSSDDEIVLDFFAGSSTTAHAVMKLNAEDGGNRRCISVQLPEPTDEKSEAYKAGYKTIAEISKERIRRAAKKIAEENPEYKGDLGFKVFKLDSSNIKSWDADFANVEQSLLDAVDNIKSDRTSEDILYEILLKYGLDLTLPIETRDAGGKRAYILGYGALIICLDDEITLDTVSAIAVLKQEFNSDITRVVFKDGGFANDVVKTNAIQMLKQHGIDDVKSV